MTQKTISILGATGSIGTSTLNVIDLHPDKFSVFAISANTSVDKMATLCQKYQPQFAVMSCEKSAKNLQKLTKVKVLTGDDGLNFIASHTQTDMVMCAIVGASGMLSTLEAAKCGKKVLLANKESLVLAGQILIKTAQKNGATIIPIDSEHSAIFQALQGGKNGLSKIQLTASGGPFFNKDVRELVNITPKQACNHPNWSMGAKISVDSATMMNKGLEVIEAHYLFGMSADDIDVVIHPQSIIHSSVYFKDGSVISQLGNPDMQTPIAYGMSYPLRICAGVKPLDLTKHKLEFFTPDYEKFKNLQLAYFALRSGEAHMGALNAANEIAVDMFLKEKIKFLDISKVVEKTLEKTQNIKLNNLDDILENDKLARVKAEVIARELS
jgi:1-deoxy-D-xylulose-5-phosphate reductoisomerase